MIEPEKSKNRPSTQKERIKVEVKQSGGKCEPISKELILELINRYNPGWNDPDLTNVTPVISDPKYDGPIGFAGIDPKLEEGHVRHVRGQKFEIEVLKTIKAYSKMAKLGLKIFHDVEFCEEKLAALSSVFESNPITLEEKKLTDLGFKIDKRTGKPILNLEVDLMILSQNSIFLIEIKSNPKDVFSAMNQLNRAEEVVSTITRTVCSNAIVPLKKIIVIPPFKQRDLELKAKQNNVTVLLFDLSQEYLNQLIIGKKLKSIQKPDQTNYGMILTIGTDCNYTNVLSHLFASTNKDVTTQLDLGNLQFNHFKAFL